MQIRKLDHVNLRTTRLETMTNWYREVLGMHPGVRPDFPFPGAWLYAGDGTAAVHLVGIEGQPATGSEVELKLEHFALSASGRAVFEEKLAAMNIAYRRSELRDFNIIQINIRDPDGNHIHIDFPADE